MSQRSLPSWLADGPRILLVRPDKLGDLVLSLPVAAALKARVPGVRVDFLASSYNAPLLKFSPHVDGSRLQTDGDNRPRPWRAVADELALQRYAAAIFLRPDWQSAAAVFGARVPRRIGTCRRSCAVLFNRWVNNRRKYSGSHEIDLNLTLLKPLGIDAASEQRAPELRVDPVEAEHTRMELGLPADFVVVHSGSGGSAANWPRTAYAEIVQRLATFTPVVCTGKGTAVSPGMAGVHDLANRTTFDQLVHVLSRARAFLSGSTGPLHMAAALGRPAIGLFPNHAYLGPHRWSPRGPRVRVLVPEPIPGHVCTLREDGSCLCMEGIDMETVVGALRQAMVDAP